MVPKWIRHLSVLLVPLLLAVGIATHSSHATNVGAERRALASYVSTGYVGGGVSNALALVSCSALNCNSTLDDDGAFVSIEILRARRFAPVAALEMVGLKDPPDPYPPRLGILN